jgi:hypothetical protein
MLLKLLSFAPFTFCLAINSNKELVVCTEVKIPLFMTIFYKNQRYLCPVISILTALRLLIARSIKEEKIFIFEA